MSFFKQKKETRRKISFWLVLAMVVSLLPVSPVVKAADQVTSEGVNMSVVDNDNNITTISLTVTKGTANNATSASITLNSSKKFMSSNIIKTNLDIKATTTTGGTISITPNSITPNSSSCTIQCDNIGEAINITVTINGIITENETVSTSPSVSPSVSPSASPSASAGASASPSASPTPTVTPTPAPTAPPIDAEAVVDSSLVSGTDAKFDSAEFEKAGAVVPNAAADDIKIKAVSNVNDIKVDSAVSTLTPAEVKEKVEKNEYTVGTKTVFSTPKPNTEIVSAVRNKNNTEQLEAGGERVDETFVNEILNDSSKGCLS